MAHRECVSILTPETRHTFNWESSETHPLIPYTVGLVSNFPTPSDLAPNQIKM